MLSVRFLMPSDKLPYINYFFRYQGTLSALSVVVCDVSSYDLLSSAAIYFS